MTTPARLERRRFADELATCGPDAPTLCEGWTARDLAAHVVLRERRPVAALGVLVPALSRRTRRVQDKIAARAWDDLVEQVSEGPPRWSPMRLPRLDRMVNTAEFFVHHEDVRRAGGDWTARPLDDDLVDDLEAALTRSAKLLARTSPTGITLEPDGGRHRIVAKRRDPMVTVRGPVGELVMWMFGRQGHAQVSFDGHETAIAEVRAAKFGV